MSWRTVFNLEWTDECLNPQWARWIQPVKNDPYKAYCRFCLKTFTLSNMGRQAILSHERSAKHKKIIDGEKKQMKISQSFAVPAKSDKAEVSSPNAGIYREQDCASGSNILTNYVNREDVSIAEIIWGMKLVMSHSSYNSFKDAADIFKAMFPDSSIAKKVSLGSSKMAYLVAFGLSPYFHKHLIQEISDTKYVICMDEAMNSIAQKGQMDLIIRYWHSGKNVVQVRYLNSVFLNHATAQDLYEKFCEGSKELNLKNLLQISMDGPSVNIKFLRHLKDEMKDAKGYSLLDLGTCSLHIIHGAFQRGNNITKWKLNDIFSSMYRLFKDSPARRADFMSVTNSNIFPLKFCQVRWVENVNVAHRALEVFPNVKKYVESAKKNLPSNFTTGILEDACCDKLILAKFAFFNSVAGLLEPFLKKFQTPSPMAPFLYDSTRDLIRHIMSRFIKHEVLREAITLLKLFKIDVSSSKNHRRTDDIDIGVAARSYLMRSSATEPEKKNFFIQSKQFLVEMTKKILERSPINLSFVKSLSCLNPHLILSNPFICEKRMDILLQNLHESGHISALSADQAKMQFVSFLNKVQKDWKESFLAFTESSRLDTFFSDFLNNKDDFKDLWQISKLILTLSHGNASVESGFSINKDILVENLHETSLIALRTTYDSIKAIGGVTSVPITSEMIQYARLSRNRYHLALEEKNEHKEKEKRLDNEKKRMKDQIKILQMKKAKLTIELDTKSKTIEEEIYELKKKL